MAHDAPRHPGQPLATFQVDSWLTTASGVLLLGSSGVAALFAWLAPPDLGPWAWPFCVLFGLLGLWLLTRTLARKLATYTITAQRIDVERGFLNKRYQSIELWRIRDVVLDQSMIDRIRGVGRLTIYSGDQLEPVLSVGPVAGSRELFQVLRDAVSQARRDSRSLPAEP